MLQGRFIGVSYDSRGLIGLPYDARGRFIGVSYGSGGLIGLPDDAEGGPSIFRARIVLGNHARFFFLLQKPVMRV